MRVLSMPLLAAAVIGCGPRSRSDGSANPRVVEAAQSGVVLVLRRNPDGSYGFGSGTVLEDRKRVLTNLHVVRDGVSLHVLPHDPARPTYPATEGGLARVIFENRSAFLDAELVRANPVQDIAVLELKEPHLGAGITLRSSPPRAGEAVLALGHPGGDLWSLTTGTVSAVRPDVIQHSAPINQGNSGGPLLDGKGRLVGLNTWKQTWVGSGGERVASDGVSYARPVSTVNTVLGTTEEAVHDLSNPAQAFLTCMRMYEGAHPDYYDQCVDLDESTELYTEGVTEVVRRVADQWAMPEGNKQQLMDAMLAPEQLQLAIAPPLEITDARELFAMVADLQREAGGAPPEEVLDKMAEAMVSGDYLPEIEPRGLARCGLRLDVRNMVALRELLRMGYFVESIEPVDEDITWLRVRGRNADASEYDCSVRMRRVERGWIEQPVRAAHLDTLPEGWPGPMNSWEDGVAILVEAQLASLKAALDAYAETQTIAVAMLQVDSDWTTVTALRLTGQVRASAAARPALMVMALDGKTPVGMHESVTQAAAVGEWVTHTAEVPLKGVADRVFVGLEAIGQGAVGFDELVLEARGADGAWTRVPLADGGFEEGTAGWEVVDRAAGELSVGEGGPAGSHHAELKTGAASAE